MHGFFFFFLFDGGSTNPTHLKPDSYYHVTKSPRCVRRRLHARIFSLFLRLALLLSFRVQFPWPEPPVPPGSPSTGFGPLGAADCIARARVLAERRHRPVASHSLLLLLFRVSDPRDFRNRVQCFSYTCAQYPYVIIITRTTRNRLIRARSQRLSVYMCVCIYYARCVPWVFIIAVHSVARVIDGICLADAAIFFFFT